MTNPYGQQYPGSGPNPQYDPYASSSPQGFPQAMPPAPPNGPYPAPGTPVYGYMAPYRPTHPLATASLILSVAGLACGLPAIAGVITGHMARKRLRAEPHYDGAGMALAGLIVGWIITGFMIAYAAFIIVMLVLAANGVIE